MSEGGGMLVEERLSGRLKRLGLRFLFVYVLLYVPTFPLNQLPVIGPVVETWDRLWFKLVPWVGREVLGLAEEVVAGRGDTMYAYLKVLCQIVLAAVGAIVWSSLSSRPGHDARINDWLRVAVRYYLATTMLDYGVAKVFNTQFPSLTLERLIQRYGDSSPMGLLWSYMGYSTAYTMFTGAGEVVGGLLLFFRRTTTLGALVVTAVMLNVVMLNFCYDVPLKLVTSHLALMSLFLLVPDLRRLADLLVLNRPTAPLVSRQPSAFRWVELARLVVKSLFVGMVLIFMTVGAAVRLTWDRASRPGLYGLYEVQVFTRDGETLPPVATDAGRWQWLVVERYGHVTVQAMNGLRERFWLQDDPKTKTLALLDWEQRTPRGTLSYATAESGDLSLSGRWGNSWVSIRLRRVDETTFLLIKQGFQWIRESPLFPWW